jgi:hypothetical protein
MGNRTVPERSTLRRSATTAFAKTPLSQPPNDFADESASATTRVMTHDSADSAALAMLDAADLGSPPEMPAPRSGPRAAIKVPIALEVEDPTHMPHPLDIPPGVPADAASAPGLVPRGDSRSMRRDHLFVLIYRLGTFVVTRAGELGQRGVWRVIEYPTSPAASNAYARECSRWVDTGYTDFRG